MGDGFSKSQEVRNFVYAALVETSAQPRRTGQGETMPIRAGIAGTPRQVQCGNGTVKKLIPMIASATLPGYVHIDPVGGRVHFATKWSPTLVVFHIKTEHVLRYVELGVFGPCPSPKPRPAAGR